MSNQYNINSNNIVIGIEKNDLPTLKSFNGNRIRSQIDLIAADESDILDFDEITGDINFYKPIDFNNVAVSNFAGGGGGDYPRAILADSADFKDADATVTSPRVVINKAGMDLYNENFASNIVFENGTDGVRISRNTTTNYLTIDKNGTNATGLNILSGDLQFAGVQISTSNLSDDFTIVNTSANNQSKVGDLTIGDSGANCVVQKGKFKIHSEVDNGSLEFSATGGNTRAFIQQNVTDNNIDIYGGSGISLDLNLKANDTVQPKLLYNGVSPNVSDWGGFDNVVTKTIDQTITGKKTFTDEVVVNQLEINGNGSTVELGHSLANGNLLITPKTAVLTNIDLQPNTAAAQGELLYNGVKPDISSWGGYATFVDTLVDKTTDQTISGVKSFTSTQITGESTGIQYGANSGNNISGTTNVMTLNCSSSMNFNVGGNNKFLVDGAKVSIQSDGTGTAYYHGSTFAEEIMNQSMTDTAIVTILNGDATLSTVKNNIIEGGYGGTTDPDFSTTHKNPVDISEFQHTFNGTVWAPSLAPNIFNVNCNLGISTSKDITRGSINYLDTVAEQYKRYTTTSGNVTLTSASGIFISFLNTAIWNVIDISGTQIGTNTSLTSGVYRILAELTTTTSDLGGFVNLKGIGEICYSTIANDPTGQPASQSFMSWSYTSGVASSSPTFYTHAVVNGTNLYMNGVSGATTSQAAFKLTLTKLMDFTVV